MVAFIADNIVAALGTYKMKQYCPFEKDPEGCGEALEVINISAQIYDAVAVMTLVINIL